jgi:hypothetical protein
MLLLSSFQKCYYLKRTALLKVLLFTKNVFLTLTVALQEKLTSQPNKNTETAE